MLARRDAADPRRQLVGARLAVEPPRRDAAGNHVEIEASVLITGDDRDIAYVTMLYEETSWRRGAHATVRLFGE